MSEILFSVVVPAYNAEKTLRRCIDSVLLPESEGVEIVLVDDGSKDRSAEICREYASIHAQVRFFQKPNGGVSTARNLGLAHAQGKYVLFLDSDDCYLDGWLTHVQQALQETNADLIAFSWIVKESEAERECRCPAFSSRGDSDKATALAGEIKGMRLNAPVAKLFRREIIAEHGLQFPEDLAIGEDLIFVFSYAMHAERFTTDPTILYCAYTDNGESLSRKRREGLLEKLLLADDKMQKVLEAGNMTEECRAIYRDALAWSYYRKAYTASKELLKYDLTAQERVKQIREICGKFDGSRIQGCRSKTRLVSLPVRWRMAGVIDLMVQYKARKGH